MAFGPTCVNLPYAEHTLVLTGMKWLAGKEDLPCQAVALVQVTKKGKEEAAAAKAAATKKAAEEAAADKQAAAKKAAEEAAAKKAAEVISLDEDDKKTQCEQFSKNASQVT